MLEIKRGALKSKVEEIGKEWGTLESDEETPDLNSVKQHLYKKCENSSVFFIYKMGVTKSRTGAGVKQGELSLSQLLE